MNVPRTAGIALALCCALVTPSADAATGSYALDGKKRTRASYTGTLTTPAFPYRISPTDPLTPALDDCDSARSCDVRELTLRLPKRTSAGRFRAYARVQSEVHTMLVLYDSTKRALYWDDLTNPNDGDAMPSCCTDNLDYELEIYVERLAAGKYTLALVDRAGFGNFQASISWNAHRPDRR